LNELERRIGFLKKVLNKEEHLKRVSDFFLHSFILFHSGNMAPSIYTGQILSLHPLSKIHEIRDKSCS
jgi:hypothetical protein